MKILFVDVNDKGHHLYYLKALISNCNYENAVLLPRMVNSNLEVGNLYTGIPEIHEINNIKMYNLFINKIIDVAKCEKPDIIHILTADVLYKFWSIGLKKLQKYGKIVLTFHRIRCRLDKRFCLKLISTKVQKIIVHSEYLKKQLTDCSINNVVCVEYPQFNSPKPLTFNSKEYWGINKNSTVIGAIGGTRYDKGLDILLEALQSIKTDFSLLIAGEPEKYDEEFIVNNSVRFRKKVYMNLHYLTDEEINIVFDACDIIALPYRRCFNGASGPLVDGVCRNKIIIGPNYKNLGYTIKENELGYVFEPENVCSLASAIELCLNNGYNISEKYIRYKGKLKLESFVSAYNNIYLKLIAGN